MNANCGRSKRQDDAAEDSTARNRECPPNELALARLHQILDDLGTGTANVKCKRQSAQQNKEEDSSDEGDKPRHSEQMHNALCTTTQLWKRNPAPWDVDASSRAHSQIDMAKHKPSKHGPRHGRKKEEPETAQSTAYVHLTKVREAAWWKKLQSSDKPPTAEQRAFLKCVAQRCSTEQQELHQWNAPGGSRRGDILSEPERVCLFGDPGAGKSHCIHLLRDFFETVMQWEHGVQFQFLATQNSMAELIGGSTVHTWGSIPANKAAATAKCNSKDRDWDQLFENCISLRWLIIDESSTLSPGLLATLESYLRDKACLRHPYAFRGGKRQREPRPFGGLNVAFSGDLDQLPPVKDVALYGNPLRKLDGTRYEAGEQRMMAMFWECHTKQKDRIHKLFELTEAKRCKDRWHLAILHADRSGAESWEMYCFVHGLPTQNPGTWMPDLDAPTCGDSVCKTLGERWESSWRRGALP